jgi:beta-glucosidase/6-phospho-beta-glucosidase/beta-galactosidase
MTSIFPAGFSWGTGTSAYQVEGAWDADGKAPSVWDTFQHGGMLTPDGTTGDIAIDQYHRFDEDLDLLQRLGAGVHRFSVSWPRVVTDAAGAVNPRGLDYYERVVDGLLGRGIAPALNLYHWDTPQWLEDRGGMMSREFADRFSELASVVADRLGDRVAQWFTMNEPTHPSLGAYVAGFLAPNRREGVAGLATVHPPDACARSGDPGVARGGRLGASGHDPQPERVHPGHVAPRRRGRGGTRRVLRGAAVPRSDAGARAPTRTRCCAGRCRARR